MFSYIGVMRPGLFEAGNALDSSKMQVNLYTLQCLRSR